MSNVFLRAMSLLVWLLACQQLSAHNGSVAYAYPLGAIVIDGDLSDWPKDALKYRIEKHLSDNKPEDDADFSGFFQTGYRPDTRSLYIAFTVTDNDFIEDTSDNVRWNTQDGLELSIDGRHLPSGSGVASFMYSKKLRNTNNAFYDPFAKNATWDIMEVAMVRRGNTRYYEWRVMLGDQFAVGRSVGFDFQVFDKDEDSSFSFSAWGMGGRKYVNPNSLGDVVLLPAGRKMATLTGKVLWDKPVDVHPGGAVRLTNTRNKQLWVATEVDSSGNYAVDLPPGDYEIAVPDPYIQQGDRLYAANPKKSVAVLVQAGKKVAAPVLTVTITRAPDMIPEKGILPGFTAAGAAQVDRFIETYRKYYRIPGVSLALVKDGKLVYHKTYGVRNTMTGAPVDSNTLFEAASITKPVFAFAVQKLAERGVIDLDRPLYLYLPNPDIDYDERYKLITAKHVLTHRTGFPNWRSMNENGKLDLKFTPGTSYGYSGEGFEYLKKVIEKITGRHVEQVLDEEVIQPMGLYHTFFSKNDSLQRVVANGHYDGLPSKDDLPASPGMAYSMHTEAKVFTKFMLYLFEQKGLKAATYDSMFRKHSDFNYDPGEERPKDTSYMGISLGIRETPFGKSFGHSGNNGDFKCTFEMYKDTGMGYVIFTNSNTSDALLDAIRKFLVEGKGTASQ